MKAIAQDRYGSPDVLRLEDVDRPVPADNEVLVRVHAAAVNALDWHEMRGDPYLARLMIRSAFTRRGPRVRIRGRDFAGRVDAVGRAVTRLRPGDEVYGVAPAAFAEYVRVAADGAVDAKPANLTFEQAAAVPLAGITALAGLRDVSPGQRVLINGASGGVGTFAVQIAKARGAEVTAVCSSRNADLVGSLGADHVVDYARQDFARTVRHQDLVLDLVGNRSLADLRRTLAPAGTLMLSGGGVSTGGSLLGPLGLMVRGALVSRFVRHRLVLLAAKPDREQLAALRELIESGLLTPVIDRTYSLSEVPDAIRYMERDHARAKLVITV